ncbi:MAG: hypothetical protein COT85_04095 [Chlamydiae bacterium CG10_big_fil_rev_8_21_14_0_10_42_34]|nr:MAG: hypothetical protein COT85_04095 [Chlamydiae bacterium CG10_big_fil_rev_8_21_14_0_10_42_34]
MLRFFCLLCFVSSLLSLEYKTEVKYLIPNLSIIPTEILDSLKTGADHPNILRRGFVIQQYLAVTQKNISTLCQALQDANITFSEALSPAIPGKVQEIRLMRKYLLEKGAFREIYKITLQGPGGICNPKVETADILDELQLLKIKEIFNALHPEVNLVINKLYFEVLTNEFEKDSKPIEVDTYFKIEEGKLIPYFINGEIKFSQDDTSYLDINFDSQLKQHAPYLDLDGSNYQRLKARNIALAELPEEIKDYFAQHFITNQKHIAAIAEQFQSWTPPEILDLLFNPPEAGHGHFIDQKILLNAEPFGFGPTAAIAEIFPYLKNKVAEIGYIGHGHTLDLQTALSYDKIHDDEGDKERFQQIAKNYDVFITASDFEAAQWAKELGLTLIIFDPLCWYWKHLPSIISQADFYVAQDFFHVENRLKHESDHFPEHTVVPAVLSGLYEMISSNKKHTALINIGGLNNPFMEPKDLEAFAKIVFSSAKQALHSEFHQITFATNQSIAAAVQSICPAVTLNPNQVQKVLSESEIAVMTSGLGNIYEASSMNKKVIWLPPANDSQGQQVKLLQEHNMLDASIDWSDIFEDEMPIDYFDEQEKVLKEVANRIHRLSKSIHHQEKLIQLIQLAQHSLQKQEESALAKLAQTFGIQGGKQAAESILQWVSENSFKQGVHLYDQKSI